MTTSNSWNDLRSELRDELRNVIHNELFLEIETATPSIDATSQPRLEHGQDQVLANPNFPSMTMRDDSYCTTGNINPNLNEFLKQSGAIPMNEQTMLCDSQPTTADAKRPHWSAKTQTAC